MESDDASIVKIMLPPELQYLIFEQTAYVGGLKVALKLMLVSKAIHDLIKPTLYAIFKQLSWSRSFPDFDAFSPVPSGLSPSHKPTLASLGPYARHLIIAGLKSPSRITEVISSCPNTLNLAVWVQCPFSLILPSLEVLTNLQRLSADFETITREEFLDCKVLHRLSYLDIIGFPSGGWEEWSMLTHLPNLTNMCLNNIVDIGIVNDLLLSCPSLRILILLDDHSLGWDEKAVDIQDFRLVLMQECKHVNILEDWMNGARGTLDTWSFADLFRLLGAVS
ncbi:hypothetical protein CPB84DRAFT_314050 [Gymnopilus junonius]|uniref:F-box protein n=1 Tax=Gymnopilus junonius TaxID=109634 RepID=A0A9P5NB05_GYMJU|nr:hypothetical protein CPB84DRAFT_314050 [Gymnopilus junonius]